jgi:hypothetical protein
MNSGTRNGYTRHLSSWLLVTVCCWSLLGGLSCHPQSRQESPAHVLAFNIIQSWNAQLLMLDRHCEGYRGPVSARMFAYMGIGAWQCAQPILPNAVSLHHWYEDFKPPALHDTTSYILPAALNTLYANLIHHFFPHAPEALQKETVNNYLHWQAQINSMYPSQEAIRVSTDFGNAVATEVYHWSERDSTGHMAFLYNFDKNYTIPQQRGVWHENPGDQLPPLLPRWGNCRTFGAHVGDFTINPPMPFSEEHGSAFFSQALEVFSASQPITDENRWIAEFWSDDFPGVTFSPSSRWVSIGRQVLEQQKPGLATALALYLKIGLALNDAGVQVWHYKYTYLVERPESYIRRNMRPDWAPLHQTPPFPSYPSGHSAFGGAASCILASLLGDRVETTDNSHKGRKEFNGSPRQFNSFSEMATENALSRIKLGVHFRMDCEEGLRLGRLVGQKIAALPLWKPTQIE